MTLAPVYGKRKDPVKRVNFTHVTINETFIHGKEENQRKKSILK